MKFKNLHIGILLVFSLLLVMSISKDEEKLTLADNQYKVVTVKGEILFAKSGENMKRGDLYLQGTALNFKTNDSRASIVNEKKGRFVLSGNNRGKLNILPSSNNIATRAGALINIVDLKNHFDGRYLVLNRMEVQIGSKAFPMDEENYFYVKYKHDGEVIPKKLRFEGDYLIWDRDELFKIDGNPIGVEEKEMTLYYRGIDKTLKINKFTPVFPEMEELKEEVGVLLSAMIKSTDEEKINEIKSFLNDFYGKPYEPNLNNWLKVEFELEAE